MNTKNRKLTDIGLLTSVIVMIIADLLPSFVPDSAATYRLFGHLQLWLAVQGAVFMFAAAAAGAYVARINFIGQAVSLAIGIWFFGVQFLNSIATVAGQDNLFAVAFSNILGLLFMTIAAEIGASVGRRSSKENEDNASTAA